MCPLDGIVVEGRGENESIIGERRGSVVVYFIRRKARTFHFLWLHRVIAELSTGPQANHCVRVSPSILHVVQSPLSHLLYARSLNQIGILIDSPSHTSIPPSPI